MPESNSYYVFALGESLYEQLENRHIKEVRVHYNREGLFEDDNKQRVKCIIYADDCSYHQAVSGYMRALVDMEKLKDRFGEEVIIVMIEMSDQYHPIYSVRELALNHSSYDYMMIQRSSDNYLF